MTRLPIHTLLRRSFHAQRAQIGPCIAAEGLSPGQPKILRYLAAHDGCLQKELASSCDIEPATVSKVLTGMEEAGLIRRKGSEQDKRAITVLLTDKGRAADARMQRHFTELDGLELEGFTDQETEAFSGYLARVYRNLTGKELE